MGNDQCWQPVLDCAGYLSNPDDLWPQIWVFTSSELSRFLIFIPVHSGYSMNIYPITIWTSFVHQISARSYVGK